VHQFYLSGGPGVRVDSHMISGAVVSPYYDSMVAKLIVHGADRDEAIARMERALFEARIEGVETTVGFHREVLAHPDFRAGRYDTGFLERYQAAKEASQAAIEKAST
jgi:acetyl-CoA carboxylase biotin carboxylase subunit